MKNFGLFLVSLLIIVLAAGYVWGWMILYVLFANILILLVYTVGVGATLIAWVQFKVVDFLIAKKFSFLSTMFALVASAILLGFVMNCGYLLLNFVYLVNKAEIVDPMWLRDSVVYFVAVVASILGFGGLVFKSLKNYTKDM